MMNMEKLVQIRKKLGLTQQELADKSGYSRNSIVNWETGKRAPRTVDVERLADVLGISINDFLASDVSIHSQPPLIKEVEGIEDYSYWGGVLDRARKVAKRGNFEEMTLIMPLLKSAYEVVAAEREQISRKNIPPLTSSGVEIQQHNVNGDNSLTVKDRALTRG